MLATSDLIQLVKDKAVMEKNQATEVFYQSMQAGNGSYSEGEKQNRNYSVSRQVSPYNNQGEG